MEPLLLGTVVLAAGGFAFLNGFHDVSNSVATAVRTRALTPTIAVLLAAFFNLVGALLSTSLALFFTDAGLGLPSGTTGLGILLAALLAAGIWGVLTWYRGKPSSSTHALLGGIIGASLFVGSGNVIRAVGPAAILSYLIGGLLVFLAMRMLGEMAAARPTIGSFMEYARVGLGDWAAYLVGWIDWYF